MATILNKTKDQAELAGNLVIAQKVSNVDYLYGPYVIEDGDELEVVKLDSSGEPIVDDETGEQVKVYNQAFLTSLIDENDRPTLQIGRTIGIVVNGSIRELWLQLSAGGNDVLGDGSGLEWVEKAAGKIHITQSDDVDLSEELQQLKSKDVEQDGRLEALEQRTYGDEFVKISNPAIHSLFESGEMRIKAVDYGTESDGELVLYRRSDLDRFRRVPKRILAMLTGSQTNENKLFYYYASQSRSGKIVFGTTPMYKEGESVLYYVNARSIDEVDNSLAGQVLQTDDQYSVTRYGILQVLAETVYRHEAWAVSGFEREIETGDTTDILTLSAEEYGLFYREVDALGNSVGVGDGLYSARSILEDDKSYYSTDEEGGIVYDEEGYIVCDGEVYYHQLVRIDNNTKRIVKTVTEIMTTESADAYSKYYKDLEDGDPSKRNLLDWEGLREYERLRKQDCMSRGGGVEFDTASEAEIRGLFED